MTLFEVEFPDKLGFEPCDDAAALWAEIDEAQRISCRESMVKMVASATERRSAGLRDLYAEVGVYKEGKFRTLIKRHDQ